MFMQALPVLLEYKLIFLNGIFTHIFRKQNFILYEYFFNTEVTGDLVLRSSVRCVYFSSVDQN